MASWWRLLVDKLTGRAETDASGPRRRKHPRFAFEHPLRARCSSWARFADLFTADISSGGLFLPTDERAQVGERVEIELALPDGITLRIAGEIVVALTPERAAQLGRKPGVGVKLDELGPDLRARFEELVAQARAGAPVPETFDAIGDARAAPSAPPARVPTRPPPVPAVALGGTILGIDLGTSYTSVSAAIENRVRVLPWPDGSLAIPSVVYFASKTEVYVGRPAREKLAEDPAHAVASPKRLLGRHLDDPDLKPVVENAAYRLSSAPDQALQAELWGEKYNVATLLSFLLQEAKKTAQLQLGSEVSRAVLAVPVSFERERIKMVKHAARMADLEIVEVIDEPSAAALANRFLPGFGGLVGVYDFGGGTFDFSVVDVREGDFRVLATAGDPWLGGDDFDHVLAGTVATIYKQEHQVDLRRRPIALQRLLLACEQAKRRLSSEESTELRVELPGPEVTTIDFTVRISRATAEQHWRPLIERSLDTCQQALSLVDLRAAELSAVFLSGGTTNIPAVRRGIEQRFGVEVKTGVPPEHAVCLGAGIHAAQLARIGRTTLEAAGS